MEEKEKNQEKEPAEQPDWEKKLADAERQAEQYKDLFLRKAAEFDNFKRRSETETSSIIRFANEDLILSILPVIDDLERSLKNSADAKESPLYKGIELIIQKMQRTLEAQGVRPFETVGKEFDVHFHDALLQMAKEGAEPHTILEEVEKGYMFHDKVLRHAKVIVAAAEGESQEANASSGKSAGDAERS